MRSGRELTFPSRVRNRVFFCSGEWRSMAGVHYVNSSSTSWQKHARNRSCQPSHVKLCIRSPHRASFAIHTSQVIPTHLLSGADVNLIYSSSKEWSFLSHLHSTNLRTSASAHSEGHPHAIRGTFRLLAKL